MAASIRSLSPGSTISDSNYRNATQDSSPTRLDPRSSLHHVLGNPDSRQNTPSLSTRNAETVEDERDAPRNAMQTPSAPPATGGRRKKEKDPAAVGGSLPNSSIYSGNKVRHLKKDDGEPLWRKDIQYDFLKRIFEDETLCFTNSYDPTFAKQTFANLYIDAMARSSKTSKILRDKLLTEHEPAKNMAMVCLLVNLGRMNTTLNFFPEMRAQLRTYHAIPSLQAHQDPNSYKQLQDAPRLKSILKGASEDRPEPNSLDKIKYEPIPRTNPVNLIFVLAQFAPKATELHFPTDHDFYDLIMRTGLSSESRAKAFLWLMWFYLESDFTEEGAEENPFGAGVDYDTDVRNQGVPRFAVLSKDQEAEENVDTPEEIEYGQVKMRERKRIIEADQAAFQAEQGPPKRGPKPKLHLPPDDGPSPAASLIGRIRPKFVEEMGVSPVSAVGRGRAKYDSDMDSTRSTPPPRALGGRMGAGMISTGRGRGGLKHQFVEGSSPAPHGGDVGPMVRRSRPLTAHQMAVERNRNQRVDYILCRGLRKKHHRARKIRRQEGAFFRALRRTKSMPNPCDDSEGDEAQRKEHSMPFRNAGFGGLVQLETEDDDFGEEMATYAAAFRRTARRLDRWDLQKDLNLGVMGTTRVSLSRMDPIGDDAGRDNDETEDEHRPGSSHHQYNGRPRLGEEGLDDMDKEILGIASERGAEDDDVELDDMDKTLLGIGGGDETEVDDGMEDDDESMDDQDMY
ncbi:putative Ino eighty subunit 1 [Amylocarpus encephaloides]|uniref:Ino eighty subunit 1 n=1 Tax=Amylocarpus encephaloides TaxID=45428 RepID=A0A9P8C5D1_9HELO|nr:putative Ino eighty subunit 1 [Amylocarpus encephaloides]